MITAAPDGGRSGHDVSELLDRWRAGSNDAGDELMARVYDELRRLARRYLRRERPGHTLESTALVNEAYLRLVPQRDVRWENRAHFIGIAARMMRRVLVDYERRRRAAKRDGLDSRPISLSAMAAPARAVDEIDVLFLNDALSALASVNRRAANVAELKYFAGLTAEEMAQVLDVSVATVKRDWSEAKRWLRRRMNPR